jgi:hypothetical protein
MLPVIGAMAWLWQVTPSTGYWTGIFGPMIGVGLGMGLVFVPLTTASLAGVPAADSGAASGLVNMMQLVGGAIGLGVLVSVYGTASRSAAGHPPAGAKYVIAHGTAAAFGFAALLDLCSLLVIVTLVRTRKLAPAPAQARPARETVAS